MLNLILKVLVLYARLLNHFLDLVVEAPDGINPLMLNHSVHGLYNQFYHYIVLGDILVKGRFGAEVVISSSCFELWWIPRRFALTSSSSMTSSTSSWSSGYSVMGCI